MSKLFQLHPDYESTSDSGIVFLSDQMVPGNIDCENYVVPLGSLSPPNNKPCSHCEKVCGSKVDLSQHMKTHTTEHSSSLSESNVNFRVVSNKYKNGLSQPCTPYKCHLCKLSFDVFGNLRKHYLSVMLENLILVKSVKLASCP